MKLTKSQRTALLFLFEHPNAGASTVGQAIMLGRETRISRSNQGYGRIGGGVCSRLCKMGLAYSSDGGWARYSLTSRGRDEARELNM